MPHWCRCPRHRTDLVAHEPKPSPPAGSARCTAGALLNSTQPPRRHSSEPRWPVVCGSPRRTAASRPDLLLAGGVATGHRTKSAPNTKPRFETPKPTVRPARNKTECAHCRKKSNAGNSLLWSRRTTACSTISRCHFSGKRQGRSLTSDRHLIWRGKLPTPSRARVYPVTQSPRARTRIGPVGVECCARVERRHYATSVKVKTLPTSQKRRLRSLRQGHSAVKKRDQKALKRREKESRKKAKKNSVWDPRWLAAQHQPKSVIPDIL